MPFKCITFFINIINFPLVFYDVCNQLLSRSPHNIDAFNDTFVDTMEIQLSPGYVRQLLERFVLLSNYIFLYL